MTELKSTRYYPSKYTEVPEINVLKCNGRWPNRALTSYNFPDFYQLRSDIW